MRPHHALLLAAALAPSLAAPPDAWAQRRRRAPDCHAQATAAVNAVSPAIQTCVLRTRGFERAEVSVRAVIDARGRIAHLTATAQVNGADHAVARQCIEGAVRAARFPACPSSPMTTVERNWTLQATRR